MESQPPPPLPPPSSLVNTACGGKITLTSEVSSARFRGDTIFFCLPACKLAFDLDPRTSCLADRLREEE